MLNAITRVCGADAASRRVASMPLSSGIATSINDVAVIGGYSLGLYDSPISFAGAGLIDLATHGPGTTAVGNVGKDISNGLQNSGMMAAGNVGLFESTSVSVADFGAAAGGNENVAYAVNLGGGQIADYNASGALISIIPDPSFYASGGGANGSEGGG